MPEDDRLSMAEVLDAMNDLYIAPSHPSGQQDRRAASRPTLTDRLARLFHTAAARRRTMSDDRNGGTPPLDEVLDVLKDIYLALRHSSRSKRTVRQTNVLKRCFVILEDSGIVVPRP